MKSFCLERNSSYLDQIDCFLNKQTVLVYLGSIWIKGRKYIYLYFNVSPAACKASLPQTIHIQQKWD